MITHIVIIWLKEKFLNEEGEAAMQKGIENLFTDPNIYSAKWGKSAETPIREVTDKSFHYGLSVQFDSLDAHNSYQNESDIHDEFVANCAPMFDKVVVYDI